MLVVTSVEFDAAHFLPNYEGKCANLHGHRWKLEVGVENPVDPGTGMVLDFAALKAVLKPLVDCTLDHQLLNEAIPNPTAENIVVFVRHWWEENRGSLPSLDLVKIWETEKSYAEWRRKTKV